MRRRSEGERKAGRKRMIEEAEVGGGKVGEGGWRKVNAKREDGGRRGMGDWE